MKTNLTCEASSPVGTRLRMTATSLLDPFPAVRLASRESLSRRTGRWRPSYSEVRIESLCSLPTSGAKGGVGSLPKTDPHRITRHDRNQYCRHQSQDCEARRLPVWSAALLRDSE